MRFQVRAFERSGEIVTLSVEASSPEAALRLAAIDAADVLSVRPRMALDWPRRPRRFPLVLFSQELHALLGAGIGLLEAIEALAEKEHRAEVRGTLQHVAARLKEGQPLSLALEGAGDVFPPLYVAMVRASEKTGALGDALARYVGYQSQVDQVRKKILGASIYPLLLLVAGGLVILFLLAYVVPRFATVYEGTHRDLPLLSRLLLEWGRLLQANGTLVLGLFAVAVAAGLYALTRPGTAAAFLRALWRIPALGERMRVYQLARFYRTLGMLLRGGVPLASGIDMVAGLLPPAERASAAVALQAVREGRSVSQAMEAAQLVTPVALRMLRVGERAGNMGEMMDRVATFHDEDMARWVEWVTRLFEPLLMAAIGLVIGAIVILMYLPIFELAGSVQ
ncbi:MAG TPA: type II secretion system F family protein [Ramlibacter sp.]|uniref:type II secretion system F family protein n=1 Tax=Ramlibacter sp. TaxID=1917967 RepID=UPI002ED58EE4